MRRRKSQAPANSILKYFNKTPPVPKSDNSDGGLHLSSEKEDSPKRKRPSTPASNYANKDSIDCKDPPSSPVESASCASKAATKRKSVNKMGTFVKDKAEVDKPPEKKMFIEKIFSTRDKNNKVIPSKSEPIASTSGLGSSLDEESRRIVCGDNWIHCKQDWLKPAYIMDAKKRRRSDPDYDPTTLNVPSTFLNSLSPAQRQWWNIKAAHYDSVLLFKMGKFYEMFHMDAAVGVNDLGIAYMKRALETGEFMPMDNTVPRTRGKGKKKRVYFVTEMFSWGDCAHSGFPETSLSRMTSTLVSKGYKVVRVEQTETQESMNERCKNSSRNTRDDKVVQREVCQVTMRGVQVCGLNEFGPDEATADYLYAITQETHSDGPRIGVCFVETSIGVFHLAEIPHDDVHLTALLTIMARFPPGMIVYDRKAITSHTSALLAAHWHGVRREPCTMSSAETTIKLMAEKYFHAKTKAEHPEGFQPFLNAEDTVGLTPAPEFTLAIKALGGCASFLATCLIDVQLLGMKQFVHYEPPLVRKSLDEGQTNDFKWEGGVSMILDSNTLRNLRIVNSEGCLYDKVNYCTTPMGKRLLYQWMCAPSCNLYTIQQRQRAVFALYGDPKVREEAQAILAKIPDLERLLPKIHSFGDIMRSSQHPESRAVYYEEASKRKVSEFLMTLNGFIEAQNLLNIFTDINSTLLNRLTKLMPTGLYPDLDPTLQFFQDSFKKSEAAKDGILTPATGMDDDFDEIIGEITLIGHDVDEYLRIQQQNLRCKVTYVGGAEKRRFHLEVPEQKVMKADYHMESRRKGFKRYSTKFTKELQARMTSAEKRKEAIVVDLNRRVFARFSSYYTLWKSAIQCIATLDVLLALADFARHQTGEMCLPEVKFEEKDKPYMKIIEGRHPCMLDMDMVPNDFELGTTGGSLVVLTGPNMGGKSTLMRQVGLLTVLAHMGSYVPAKEFHLSLVDRVYSRMGACDNILAGKSTFMMEMAETTTIIDNCTPHSLLLVDELGVDVAGVAAAEDGAGAAAPSQDSDDVEMTPVGAGRGTSTHDGCALATAVASHLSRRDCRTLFSTHYHKLVKDFVGKEAVIIGHMACLVDHPVEQTEKEEEIPEETITFLYKFTPGACSKSYGFNAARLAGIPSKITRRAQKISIQLEQEANNARRFRAFSKLKSAKDIIQFFSDADENY